MLYPVFFSFRVISCEEGKALAESWNAAFMESSAKENQVRAEAAEITLSSITLFMSELAVIKAYLSVCFFKKLINLFSAIMNRSWHEYDD